MLNPIRKIGSAIALTALVNETPIIGNAVNQFGECKKIEAWTLRVLEEEEKSLAKRKMNFNFHLMLYQEGFNPDAKCAANIDNAVKAVRGEEYEFAPCPNVDRMYIIRKISKEPC